MRHDWIRISRCMTNWVVGRGCRVNESRYWVGSGHPSSGLVTLRGGAAIGRARRSLRQNEGVQLLCQSFPLFEGDMRLIQDAVQGTDRHLPLVRHDCRVDNVAEAAN